MQLTGRRFLGSGGCVYCVSSHGINNSRKQTDGQMQIGNLCPLETLILIWGFPTTETFVRNLCLQLRVWQPSIGHVARDKIVTRDTRYLCLLWPGSWADLQNKNRLGRDIGSGHRPELARPRWWHQPSPARVKYTFPAASSAQVLCSCPRHRNACDQDTESCKNYPVKDEKIIKIDNLSIKAWFE